MKRFLKRYEKYISISHYISVLKRQPHHIQNISAFLFAFTVTFLIGCFILYFEYGFWRDKYIRQEEIIKENISFIPNPQIEIESPSQMVNSFFKEAAVKFNSIKDDGVNFLKDFDGKESYNK